jgi:hypothetical protein
MSSNDAVDGSSTRHDWSLDPRRFLPLQLVNGRGERANSEGLPNDLEAFAHSLLGFLAKAGH